MSDERARTTDEMARTAFQRKVVTREPAAAVLEDAVAYFTARGYRAGRAARPNQIFVMGGREGSLPRVTAEILIQPNVGKAKTTLVTISGFGEDLSHHLKDYATHVRARGRAASTTAE